MQKLYFDRAHPEKFVGRENVFCRPKNTRRFPSKLSAQMARKRRNNSTLGTTFCHACDGWHLTGEQPRGGRGRYLINPDSARQQYLSAPRQPPRQLRGPAGKFALDPTSKNYQKTHGAA